MVARRYGIYLSSVQTNTRCLRLTILLQDEKKKLFATMINRTQLKITIKKLFYKANKTKQQCETLTCKLIA